MMVFLMVWMRKDQKPPRDQIEYWEEESDDEPDIDNEDLEIPKARLPAN
jgi:hypothetical protein